MVGLARSSSRLVWCWILLACTIRASAADGRPALLAEIEDALAAPAIRGGVQSILIQSLATNEMWYERNGGLLMMPASNQKLLTSAAALHLLGPEFRFETAVLAASKPNSSGLVTGDIVVKGSGDPFLDDAAIKGLAKAMRANGVRAISGGVIGDGSAFTDAGYGDGWAWDDMTYYYSVPVSGLNVNSNVIRVRALPGKRVGDPAVLVVTPTDRYAEVRSKVTTAAKGVRPRLTVYRRLGLDVVDVTGHVAVGTKADGAPSASVSVQNPPLYAAMRLAEVLRASGVSVARAPRVGIAGHQHRIVLAKHTSPPLSEMIVRLNKPSDNLAAECLLRAIGLAKSGTGSVAAGRKAVFEWFTSIGMDTGSLIMMDGSGLSRQDYVTGRNLLALLHHMHGHRHANAFQASLPIAGVDGTLRNRMKGTPAAGNCRAKTGYVSNVSSLSGYVTTATGEPLVFVILMNNHPCRNAEATAVQDRIVKALASYRD